MKTLLITITLTATLATLYIKRSYKYASVPDTVDPPIDYKSDQYKEDETWFSGMGRC